MKNTRIETDTIGKYKVPKNALYGSQTQRSFDAIKVTNRAMDYDLIKSIIHIKKVEAIVNEKYKRIKSEDAKKIIWACNEVLNNFSKYKKYFITDEIQGGAGTSVNMNVNELLSNLASKNKDGKLGTYAIHPNDVINMGQSTNDVFPTAGKISFVKLTINLYKKIEMLQKQLLETSKRFKGVVRVGKTHLQDAVPINADSLFTAWSSALERDKERLNETIKRLLEINIGGTAIGTGIFQEEKIVNDLFRELSKEVDLKLVRPKSFIDSNRNTDIFLELSNNLKTFIIGLSKNCNDIRLLSSGPSSGFAEIKLPAVQPGSSIMPGKVNPIIPETINQVAFAIIGRNATISYAVEAGQLELNVFEPIIFTSMFESLRWSIRACDLLKKYVLKGIKPNLGRISNNLTNSSSLSTFFAKKYGYSLISKITYKAIQENKNVLEEIKLNLNITPEEIEKIVNVKDGFPLKEEIDEK